MIRRSCAILLLSLSLVYAKRSYAQVKDRISAAYSNASFDEFVSQIESQSDYRFFYDKQEMDSFRLNIQVSRITVPELLKQVFQHSKYFFTIDTFHYVVVSRHQFHDEVGEGPETGKQDDDIEPGHEPPGLYRMKSHRDIDREQHSTQDWHGGPLPTCTKTRPYAAGKKRPTAIWALQKYSCLSVTDFGS